MPFGVKVIKALAAESTVSLATAITALNVLIAAEIVIVEAFGAGENQSSVTVGGYAQASTVAVGPLNLYSCSIVLSYLHP